jgi:gluconolactonase
MVPRLVGSSLGVSLLVAALAPLACSSSNGTGNVMPSPSGGGGGGSPTLDGGGGAGGIAAVSDGGPMFPDGAAPDGGGAWACPAGPFKNPLDGVGSPQVIEGVPPQDGFVQGQGVLEGPVWRGGALYVTQFENHSVPTSRILEWTPDGGVSVFLADSGANGLAVDAKGTLFGAVHKDGSISSFADPSNPHALASQYDGARFDSPNDLALRTDGTVYFTDPTWQSPDPAPQPKTRVYRVSPGGSVAVVDEGLDQPNGVTLSPDETKLYVSGLSGVHRYDVAADGSVSGKIAFAPQLQGSDGMGVDCAGNLYVAYQASVVVLAPTGDKLGQIDVDGAEATTNVAFGGADRRTLFITHRGNSQGLHQLKLNVPGLPY